MKDLIEFEEPKPGLNDVIRKGDVIFSGAFEHPEELPGLLNLAFADNQYVAFTNSSDTENLPDALVTSGSVRTTSAYDPHERAQCTVSEMFSLKQIPERITVYQDGLFPDQEILVEEAAEMRSGHWLRVQWDNGKMYYVDIERGRIYDGNYENSSLLGDAAYAARDAVLKALGALVDGAI